MIIVKPIPPPSPDKIVADALARHVRGETVVIDAAGELVCLARRLVVASKALAPDALRFEHADGSSTAVDAHGALLGEWPHGLFDADLTLVKAIRHAQVEARETAGEATTTALAMAIEAK